MRNAASDQTSAIPLVLRLLLCGCVSAILMASEPMRAVPAPVADLLNQTAQAESKDVIRLIDGWTGPAHPLLALRRAQARWRIAQEAPVGERTALIAAAERDFTATLVQDTTLAQAHLGLAQCAVAREDWQTASRAAAAGIDITTADRNLITFLADAALHAGDWRLATLAAQHGILRFPDDTTLRRIELAVLVHAGRAEDARQATLALLARNPEDVELWRHLAWSAQETGRGDESLAALEAALALRSDDRDLRRQLAEAQLARNLPQAALATVKPLIGDPPAATVLADDSLMVMAARAAADGGKPALARAWLAAVPEKFRSRHQRLAAARLAVQAGDQVAAGAALDALVAAGEHDAAVLTWAASLAETRGEVARAETLLLQAARVDNPAGAVAALRLAAFYLTHERPDEARTVLAAYLAKRPDDTQAKALQAHLDRRN